LLVFSFVLGVILGASAAAAFSPLPAASYLSPFSGLSGRPPEPERRVRSPVTLHLIDTREYVALETFVIRMFITGVEKKSYDEGRAETEHDPTAAGVQSRSL